MSDLDLNFTPEQLADIFANTEVPTGFSAKFPKTQGPATAEMPRIFAVTGPKADKVRSLIFADLGLTRKEIAHYADCSVSRVGEIVWGLQHDDIDFPAIPLRHPKPAAAATEEQPEEDEDDDDLDPDDDQDDDDDEEVEDA